MKNKKNDFPPYISFIGTSWEEYIDGKETAYHVLKTYVKEIAIDWHSPKTHEQYGGYFEDYILPRLNRKPLCDYTKQDIRAILQELKEIQMRRSPKPYKPSSVSKFETLIKKIFRVAMAHGICDDIFWLDREAVRAKSHSSQKTAEKTRLPKSLRIAVEKAVAKKLLGNFLMSGVYMALLLMFAFGLRNSEALGAVYGNIMQIGGFYYLATHSTPDDETAFITIGGKTYNMYRILPIPAFVLPILQMRRAYLEAEIAAGRISLDPTRGILSVDDLPIANSEYDWTVSCSANRLIQAGRTFFADAKIEGEMIYYLTEEMAENYSEIVYGKERDLTAYLLRRTFGEHLRECGCSPALAERCMGHVQTDDRNKNNDFANEDDLKKLTRSLSRRPLLNSIEEISVVDISEEDKDIVFEDVSEVILEFPRVDHDAEYLIQLISNEALVPPEVTLTPLGATGENGPYIVEYATHRRALTKAERESPPADVNVIYDYQKGYSYREEKKKEKKK